MSINRLFVVSFLVLGLQYAGSASGQGIPGAEHKAIGRLVGSWKCVDRSGGTVVEGDLVADWNPSKTAVIWHWRGPLVDDPKRPITSSGILAWDGLKKAVVEHAYGSTGEMFSASHKITEKRWTSPLKGALLIQGKFKKEKALRIFKFNSDDELVIVAMNRMVDGKEAPDIVSTFTRVKK